MRKVGEASMRDDNSREGRDGRGSRQSPVEGVGRDRPSRDNRSLRSRSESGTDARGESDAATKRRLSLPLLIVLAVILLIAIVVLGRFCSAAATIEVTVNGNALSLHGAKTLDTAIRESGWPVNPGDFISLDGMVLKRGEGNPFYATVNGEETIDREKPLSNGDEIYLTDGTDIVEDYDSEEEIIPCGTQVLGLGAICTFEEGVPKIVEHLTGRVSGAEVDRLKQAEEKLTAQWRVPDVGGDKVIALTFDCGPSAEYTGQILDVLAENEVKATFFCEGKNVKENPSLVQREREEGHQVASNTFSCTVDANTSAERVLDEVWKGFDAVDDALGAKRSTRIVRFPNALLTVDMTAVIADQVDAVIGWDLDSGDWTTTNSDTVYDVLLQAEPGDIVVMHDGDYNCSSTASALRKALPKLKEQGYSFVTIDELMAYPAKSNDEIS